MLACTSDKGSLHVFDVINVRRNTATPSTPPHSPGKANTANGGCTNSDAKNRWGFLSNIPFGPFQDVYSFASTRFEAGDEPLPNDTMPPVGDSLVLGTRARPVKGVIGWVDESSLVVVGAGKDARWEKFVLGENEDGRFVVREGWKRYLGN